MKFLNVSPLELILLFVLIIIVLGPQDMVRVARQIGKVVRTVTKSSMWKTMLDTSREIRDIPKMIIKESGLEDSWKEIQESTKEIDNSLNEAISFSSTNTNNNNTHNVPKKQNADTNTDTKDNIDTQSDNNNVSDNEVGTTDENATIKSTEEKPDTSAENKPDTSV